MKVSRLLHLSVYGLPQVKLSNYSQIKELYWLVICFLEENTFTLGRVYSVTFVIDYVSVKWFSQ